MASRDILPGTISDGGDGRPPAGYKKLPDDMRCKCVNSWRSGDGSYWCCARGGEPTAPDTALTVRSIPDFPSLRQAPTPQLRVPCDDSARA